MAAVSSVFRQGLFKGRVAVVTGGGTGIGQAIALELMHLGCSVVIASRKIERLQEAAESMQSRIANSQPGAPEPTLSVIKCNIREEQDVQHMLSNTLQQFGRLDFLVNNAGGQFPSAAAHISLKGWNAVVDTNLTGTFLCCREAYTQWMKDNGGAIVNIVADMFKGFPGMCHTGAARAAVDNLTKSLAIEWADSGTRINAVAPGGFIVSESALANYGSFQVSETEKNDIQIIAVKGSRKGSSIVSDTALANYGSFNVFETVKNGIPAKRYGKVEEISAAVCFLLSPAAAFITGETLYVDGGGKLYQTMWPVPDHSNSKAYTWEDDNPSSSSLPLEDNTKSKL